MTKIIATHVYEKALPSADATGVTFAADGHLFVFPLGRQELQRLARQIDGALKQQSARAQKRAE